MHVKLPRTSPHYVGTIDLDSPADSRILQGIRAAVSHENKRRPLTHVSFGRDHKKMRYVKLHGRQRRIAGWPRNCREIPLADAQFADIYIYTRITWNWKL